MTSESNILTRLHQLRGRVRRRLLAYGVCAVLAGGVVALLTIVLLDWLLGLPAPLRLLGGLLFFTGFVGAAYYWIVRPLLDPLPPAAIAARLETHFGYLQDRLSSAVNFIERGVEGSVSLGDRVIAGAEQAIATLPLHRVLSWRPLAARAVALVLGVTALTSIAIADRAWLTTGVYRYLYPFGDIEWPREVSILPLTGNQTVAVGESVTVRLAIERGQRPDLRAIVYLRDAPGHTVAMTMQPDRDGTYYATIDAVTSDLTYWFEAGDDSTRRTPLAIHVVRRPAVVDALAHIEPPPYAAGRATQVRDLNDGAVHAPIGGRVQVRLRTNKPIPLDAGTGPVGLQTETGDLIPLQADPADPLRLSADLPAETDVHFRVLLRDSQGFENREAPRYSIIAVPDAPPAVAVLEPSGAIELTPEGVVPLRARVEDDFGVTSLSLSAERVGTGDLPAIDLTQAIDIYEKSPGLRAMASYAWDLAPLALAPGDMLIYRLIAHDNRGGAGAEGQRGESAPMRIRIISTLEFDIRVRSDLARLEAQVRETTLEQGAALDQIAAMIQNEEDPEKLSPDEQQQAATLAAGQARLARRLRDLADRFNSLTRRMENNRSGDEAARIRIEALGETLRQTAAGPVTSAGHALSEAREHEQPQPQQNAVARAGEQAQEATDRLQALLKEMAEWSTFQELLTRTRDLLQRQNELRNQTARLGQSMLGKSPDSLTESETAALKNAARRQEQLATDLARLVTRMEELADAQRKTDVAGAEAAEAAARAARANDAARHMEEAAGQIEGNRTAAATVSQRQASEAMQKMVAALKEREDRALEELRKRVASAREQVTRLLEHQTDLRAATHEAGLMQDTPAAFHRLGDEQRTLAGNTRLTAIELAREPRTASAARILKQATAPMDSAETAVRAAQAGDATVDQDEAIALLEDTIAELDRVAENVAEEQLRRSLAEIRDNLHATLEAQLEINEGIAGLRRTVQPDTRLGRLEARQAAQLARLQAALRNAVQRQLPDFELVAVYRWVMERIAGWMETSQSRLDQRRIDEELSVVTDRIAGELRKLIEAIEQTQELPIDPSFVEGDQSGGGEGAAGAAAKPVPTVAELLVLKAMQADINDRTQSLHEKVDPDTATEAELRQLQTLGEDQAEVRKLAEMVTQRVRQP